MKARYTEDGKLQEIIDEADFQKPFKEGMGFDEKGYKKALDNCRTLDAPDFKGIVGQVYEEGVHYVVEEYPLGNFKTEKIIAEIKYLHQLQNLYFALTGEELPISL